MSKGSLSSKEQAVWHALKRLGEGVLARVGAEIEAATQMSGADFAILSRLEELGSGTLSQQSLIQSLNWEKSRLSHQLTRMEARALVARVAASSGRSVDVNLLDAGARAIEKARPVHVHAVRSMLKEISEEEQKMLVALMDRLEAIRPVEPT